MWASILIALISSLSPYVLAQANKESIHFDAVSIRENNSGAEQGYMVVPPNGDRLIVKNTQMFRIIGFAFHKQRKDLIEGLPEWARDTHWDIEAVIAPESLSEFHKMSFDQQSELLKTILAGRCGLIAYETKKEVPVYDLVVSKSGLKMKEVPAPDPETATKRGAPSIGWDLTQRPGQIHARAITMDGFIYALSKAGLSRQVMDKTGLKGRYDINLRWTPEDAPSADQDDNGSPEGPPPSIFTALQDKLGLKLEPSKALVDAVVVSHIDKPSPN